jgi:hypothetical protein
MSVFFDHDTAQKTRRAIIITSVVAIALHYVQLGSNELEIFKLKIIVQKENIIVFLKFALAYLTYMYLTYEFGTYWGDRKKRPLVRMRDNHLNSLKSLDRTEAVPNLTKIERQFNERENQRIVQISNISKVFRDHLPVFFLLFLVFSGWHDEIIGKHIIQLPLAETELDNSSPEKVQPAVTEQPTLSGTSE